MEAEVRQRVVKGFAFSRRRVYLLLLLLYVLPLLLVMGYAFTFAGAEESRGLFLVALLTAGVGGGCAFFLLRLFERQMRRSVGSLVRSRLEQMKMAEGQEEELARLRTYIEEQRRGYEHQLHHLHTSTEQAQTQISELNLQMDKKLEEVRLAYHEYEDMRKEYDRLQEEYTRCRQEAERDVEQRDTLLKEYQHTIGEQRAIIEKKQHYIARLEGKVRDLMYEIRSLLQLEAPKVPPTPLMEVDDQLAEDEEVEGGSGRYDLSVKLRTLVERAEKLTGADHLGYMGGKSPRFHDVGVESYAIDLRRLFDTFRQESDVVVFVFSQRERKLLFVNNLVKNALGWRPDKFIHDFPHLVTQGFDGWKGALGRLEGGERESHASLHIRGRERGAERFECVMGRITKGPFVGHVIGLLGG